MVNALPGGRQYLSNDVWADVFSWWFVSSVCKLLLCLVKGGTLISPESGVLLSIPSDRSGGTFLDCPIGFLGQGEVFVHSIVKTLLHPHFCCCWRREFHRMHFVLGRGSGRCCQEVLASRGRAICPDSGRKF